MYSIKNVRKARVYIKNKKGKVHKLGRAYVTVFHPSKPQAVGVLVKRPDLLLMIKRSDWFVAFDSLKASDGNFLVDGTNKSAFGPEACKRLGINYDQCILWEGMKVSTESGTEIGEISDVFFDKESLMIDHIDVSSGGVDRALVGASVIPQNCLLGYRDGKIEVKDEAAIILEEGGVAAKAGEAWAKGKHAASDASAKAGEAINKGAYKTGQAIGAAKRAAQSRGVGSKDDVKKAAKKQVNKSLNMFKEFKEEFNKAAHDDE